MDSAWKKNKTIICFKLFFREIGMAGRPLTVVSLRTFNKGHYPKIDLFSKTAMILIFSQKSKTKF